MLLQVIIFSLIGGLFSAIGGVLLIFMKLGKDIASYLTSFAAGVLLTTAFMDLLPEALEGGSEVKPVMLMALSGLIFFFLLEGFIHWFHSHNKESDEKPKTKPIVPLIIIGDTIHNFIDGIAIAAGFLISPINGIIVTLAVAAHEIPQEMGDFMVMLHSGVSKKKVILFNLLSALASTLSAVIFYIIGSESGVSVVPLVAITAGFFIYIATTDIIPMILHEESRKIAFVKSMILIFGVIITLLVSGYLHGIIEENSGHDHEHASWIMLVESI